MATRPNIINDLATYTRVPTKVLNELTAKAELCIGSAIHDALLEKETATVLDIGIGTLSVNLVDMDCKFVPSKELKAVIKKSLSEQIDPAELILEESLIQKLLTIYEEEF